MPSLMVSQNEIYCSTFTFKLVKKGAITSLRLYQFAYVRHYLVHLADYTKNEKCDELKRLVYERLIYLGNNNYKGTGDLGKVLLSNCIFVPEQLACVVEKICMIMNYSQAQSNGFLIMKRESRFLKSERRDISLSALVVYADTTIANNHLDTLAIWMSQDLLSIQGTLIINWLLIGWIQVVLINFFSTGYVMLWPDFKDKITLQNTGISLSMYCIQIDPFYLYEHVDNCVIFRLQDCKDFEDAIQWSQCIRLAFFTDSIKIDILHIFYPACHIKFLLSFMDSVDEINILYFQIKFLLDCAQINTYIFNIFNTVGYIMSTQDFKNFRMELNKKECEQQFRNECICISSSSQVGTWETERFKRFIRRFTKIENRNRMLVEENQIIKEELLEKDRFIEEMKKQLDFLKNDKLVSERKNLLEHEDMRRKLLKKDELMDEKTKQFKMLESETLSLESKCLILEEKLSNLQEECQKIKKDYEELILEHGRILVENDLKVNKVKETEQFQKVYIPKSSTSSVLNMKGNNSCNSGPMQNILSQNRVSLLPSSSSSPSQKQSVGADGKLLGVSEGPGNSQKRNESNGRDLNIENESNVLMEQLRFSIEVVERDNAGCIRLINQPSSSVPADVYNSYKFLLLTISDWLLYDDIIKLQKWANENFSVQNNLNAHEVLVELDKKGAINVLDLSQLCVFFGSIVRHDLLYLIDEFKNGDYDKLRKLVYQNKSSRRVSNSNQVQSRRLRIPNSNTPGPPRRSAGNSQVYVSNTQVNVSNGHVLERPSAAKNNNPTSQVGCDHQRSGSFGSNFPSTSSSRVRSGLLIIPDVSGVTNTRGNPENERRTSSTDAPVMTEPVRHKQTHQSRQTPSQCNHSHSAAGRCDGTHSHTDAHLLGASNNQDNWLCDHYKRRCWVKFECCDRYWACHRCHNNESTCGHRKLKSRDTTMIKCVECGKEQKFGQFCVSCNTQFADFFCGICKHLTGTDDHPYHCDKCGICRIHGDRSYHCDVCGICLDVQLRGNHKCRPDSAHDECCICLEDAFTGCQILPCSHKVHKDCATQMIRMGITRCPMCRESFAHKLERRPVKKKTTRRRHRTSPANS